MLISKLIIILLILFVLLSFGCQRKVCNLPPPNSNVEYPPVSNSLNVDVYLDATLSMKGFIVPEATSYYQQTLPLLESSVERGWPGGQVSFYKFGTKINALSNRQHLDAVHPNFYSDSDYNLKTYIENVIDAANTSNLTIIVTDLFQDKVDVNLLTGKLKDKYVSQRLAVGVVGIKSEFKGSVYDVGQNNYSFDYESHNDDPASFRPFYLIALGKHADIEHYFDVLYKSGLQNFPVKESIILSPFLSARLASFENAKITSANKIVEVGGLIPIGAKDTRIKQFRIRGLPQTASFAADLQYQPLNHVIESAPELVSEVRSWKCEESAGKNRSHEPESLIENSEAQRAFNIKSARVTANSVQIEANVVPAALPGDAIYCFEVILRPSGYRMPDWISQWDMDAKQIEEWKKNPKKFQGWTTFNLKYFLDNIWETIVQSHGPKVADLYCYIQRG